MNSINENVINQRNGHTQNGFYNFNNVNINGNNNQEANENEAYGHFAITTGVYPEPWVNSPQVNSLNYGQMNGVPRQPYPTFSMYPMPAFFPAQNLTRDPVMIPPPTPNILSVYMYDHAMNFGNQGFHNNLHLPNFFYSNHNHGYNAQQGMMLNNQYVLPPIEEAQPIVEQVNSFNANNLDGYNLYNQQQHWGQGWSGHNQTVQFKNTTMQPNTQFNNSSYQSFHNSLRSGQQQNIVNTQNLGSHNFTVTTYHNGFQPIAPNLAVNPYQNRYNHSMNRSLAYQVVPGTNISIKNAKEIVWRDNIIHYAHSLYNTNPHSPILLPMLLSLNQLHPNHVPLLLLLACVSYNKGDLQSSLKYHYAILEIDPKYVDAMNNIGITLRNLGQLKDAEAWWWKAIHIRPDSWDVIDSLLGILTNPAHIAQIPQNQVNGVIQPFQPRFEDAYKLCCYIEKKIVGNIPFEDFCKKVAQIIGQNSIGRFQSLLYHKGNTLFSMGKLDEARKEYEKAIQLVLGGQTIFDMISQILALYMPPNTAPSAKELEVFDLSRAANILLPPGACLQLCSILFNRTNGCLPGTVDFTTGAPLQPPQHLAVAHTTSMIVLTLVKIYQDTSATPHLFPLILPIYYLSLSLCPSPSTCNNLGILLSNLPPPPPPTDSNQHQVMSGTNLALQYYSYGLTLDQRHPHLYTNLGSLLKDMGNISEAIRMYEKAVECNPKFDVALANLGNALKDSGRTQDSIQWYMRAVEINPDFSEAVCGLVNALGGICDWRNRHTYIDPNTNIRIVGWMDRAIDIVYKQLTSGAEWARGVIFSPTSNAKEVFIADMVRCFQLIQGNYWLERLEKWGTLTSNQQPLLANEGSWMIRAIEKGMRQLQRFWYWKFYRSNPRDKKIMLNEISHEELNLFKRPTLPRVPLAPLPTVLPFHTFTYPLTPRQCRVISHRNALRLSHSTLCSPWLPTTVYPPPQPVINKMKLGYVSSDFNNHPLAHLMQSVFGFHDTTKFEVYLYATTPADDSIYRAKISSSTPNFLDVSGWSTQAIVERIHNDGIHILINLNGYTKGARNEVFAARPAPVLMSYMGFAGTLGGHWSDWFIVDPIVCPPQMVCSDQSLLREKSNDLYANLSKIDELDIDPEEESESWVYTEKIIYLPHSYFVNDHRQGFRDPDDPDAGLSRKPLHYLNRNKEDLELLWLHEEDRRWRMRAELFPHLHPDTVIFANFNQLYKIDPSIFNVWLTVLKRVPNSVLWLLRFPAAGEVHLRRTAIEVAGQDIANRIIFTDVAAKDVHIHRGRIADIFFDTPECNAHTTACDILWSGTPIVTFARHTYKLCSRVAASIAYATGYGSYMVTDSEDAYADQAVKLANSLSYQYVECTDNEVVLNRLGLNSSPNLPPDNGIKKKHRLGQGQLIELRKALFLTRDHSRLFDTPRWVKNLEKGYKEAWDRWESGQDDRPTTLSFPVVKQSTSHHLDNIMEPKYTNHLQDYLQSCWNQGKKMIQTGCIWIQDDDDDYMIARRVLSTSNSEMNDNVISKTSIHSVLVNPPINFRSHNPNPNPLDFKNQEECIVETV